MKNLQEVLAVTSICLSGAMKNVPPLCPIPSRKTLCENKSFLALYFWLFLRIFSVPAHVVYFSPLGA